MLSRCHQRVLLFSLSKRMMMSSVCSTNLKLHNLIQYDHQFTAGVRHFTSSNNNNNNISSSDLNHLLKILQQLKIPAEDKPKPQIPPEQQQDSSLPDRYGPKWDHLRSLKSLESMIGKTIKLPAFPVGFLPKEMKESQLESFILTQERYDLVVKFWNSIKLSEKSVKGEENNGIILSGPNGCGKTFESYLLTSIAYVNDCIVTYIGRTGEWAKKKTDEEAAQYFLDRFIAFNAIRASKISIKSTTFTTATTLLELANLGTGDEHLQRAVRVCDELFQQLRIITESPVVYAVDEHNELWKNPIKYPDGSLSFPYTRPFFRSFIIGTSALQGSRTILLISGSAHSQFEHNLQPALDRWIHYVTPFSFESFVLSIKEGGPIALPPKWQETKEQQRELHRITGGTPREILRLQQWSKLPISSDNPMDFAVYSKNKRFYPETISYWRKIRDEPSISSGYLQFLNLFFSKDGHQPESPGSFVDTGLIYYQPKDGTYHSTCYGAFLALFHFHFSGTGSPLSPLSSAPTTSIRGAMFERWVIHRLITGRIIKHAKSSEGPQILQFPTIERPEYMTEYHVPFNPTKLASLYLPSNENAYWDIVVHQPPIDNRGRHMIYFIQVSISSFNNHDKNNKIEKSMTRGHPKNRSIDHSVVETIVTGITGLECKSSISKNTLILDCPKVDIKFIYVTETPDDTSKYKNMIVIDKKSCEQDLMISFN